jgi:phthalate 4,5-cis-dihydrodiol dehydrogenase
MSQGGGMPYRQGPHQVDTVRILGGGMLRSVRAHVGQWMPERPIPGYYAAFLEFEDGTPAIVAHNGYGYFLGAELVPWGSDKQHYTVEERIAVRQALRTGARNETEDKQALRIGGSRETEVFSRSEHRAWVPHDLGFLVVSCERGDMRQSPFGIYVHDDSGKREIETTRSSATGGTRRAELQELYDAVIYGKPVWHDGRWGLATLEACLAIMTSARERREVRLEHQVPVRDDYDREFEVAY